MVLGAAAAWACLPARAQWGSIRANNRTGRQSRAPAVPAARSEQRDRAGLRGPAPGRAEMARPNREFHEEEHRRPELDRGHRHLDIDEDRRRGYFWSGISPGMQFNTLPFGYVPLSVGGIPYYYSNGAYYQQEPSGYMAVIPPVGAVVPALPPGAEALSIGQGYFYAGGAFYLQQPQGFVVVSPPLGATVEYLPPGAMPVYIRGVQYYQADGAYFLPVIEDGVTVYTTVQP